VVSARLELLHLGIAKKKKIMIMAKLTVPSRLLAWAQDADLLVVVGVS